MSHTAKKSPLRIGVIGAGFGQQVHVPAFRSDQRCKVVAICASTDAKAKEVANLLDIEYSFGDWKQLVHSKEVGAISIAVPPTIQANITLEALKLGKPVFCEKPLAVSIASAQSIVEAAKQFHLANLIDFEFPEIPQWQRAKKLIDSQRLGCLHYVCISWHVETYANRMQTASWKSNSEQGGGVLNTFVSHCFYYIEWLLGPIKKISAILSKPQLDIRDCDTTALLQLVTESGVVVALNVSTSAFLGNGHHLEFYGDKATLVLSNPSKDYVKGFQLLFGDRNSEKLEPIIDVDDWHNDTVGDGRVLAVSRLVTKFIDSTIDGSPQLPGFREGLRVQQLIEASRQSMQTKRWIGCQYQEQAAQVIEN